jgi:hypothetical protein
MTVQYHFFAMVGTVQSTWAMRFKLSGCFTMQLKQSTRDRIRHSMNMISQCAAAI